MEDWDGSNEKYRRADRARIDRPGWMLHVENAARPSRGIEKLHRTGGTRRDHCATLRESTAPEGGTKSQPWWNSARTRSLIEGGDRCLPRIHGDGLGGGAQRFQ